MTIFVDTNYGNQIIERLFKNIGHFDDYLSWKFAS